MIDQLIPDIEEDIALPKNASEAWPNLNITEELNMRKTCQHQLEEVKVCNLHFSCHVEVASSILVRAVALRYGVTHFSKGVRKKYLDVDWS
jgi:hypothetical protein